MKKAILVKTLALAACAFAVHDADAHSPAAVDANGNRCIQMDCGKDQIVNRCQFPVQLTYECGENAHCDINAAGTYNSPVENRVTVIGSQFFSGRWNRKMLRPDGFYPMQINRKTTDKITLNPADGRHPLRGYGCAIHTGGDVTSAGSEWHEDENGNAVLVCVHTHADGSTHREANAPDFQCPAELVNNWAGDCMQMKYDPPTPDSPLNPVYLVNTCKCPVALDACHEAEHPCHGDDSTKNTFAPGESVQVGSTNLQGFRTEWAACFQTGADAYDPPREAGENSWTCHQTKTACSTTRTAAAETAAQFRTMRHDAEAVAETEAETETEESPQTAGTLRGSPPPTNTPTEEVLKTCGAWNGQLNPDAILNLEGNDTIFQGDSKCEYYHHRGHLHFAARFNDLASARWLLANGANVHDAKGLNGLTPLHIASWDASSNEVVELFLQSGAKVSAKTIDSWTPLHLAALENARETAELLLQNGAEVNAKTNDGETPLHPAAYTNALETVELMLQNGADVDATNNDGQAPLDIAIEREHAEMQSLLCDAEIEKASNLHNAANNNKLTATRCMIKNGAEVNAKNYDGHTPLDVAIKREHAEMQALLRRHGAVSEIEAQARREREAREAQARREREAREAQARREREAREAQARREREAQAQREREREMREWRQEQARQERQRNQLAEELKAFGDGLRRIIDECEARGGKMKNFNCRIPADRDQGALPCVRASRNFGGGCLD